jgi:hypothetical protein
MTRSFLLIVSALIIASTIPSVASECVSSKDIAASRSRWAAVRSQPPNAVGNDTNCRAYAASFYESVTLRQAAAMCARETDNERNLAVLDSEVDAFNNLLATKCGS